jgi:ketosteroid isomerase-like protein
MSQESVDLMRAVFAAWNAGDMDAVREVCDPEIIVRSPEGWPEPGPFLGQDAVIRAFEQLRETFDSDWQELVSDIAHVGDRVAVRTVWHGVGHGPELKQESSPVFTVRNGRVYQIEFFADHAKALEALGLSEEATSRENVELVRSSIEAYSAGDRDAYLAFFAEDVEVCPDVSRFPDAEPFRGRLEFRRFVADIDEGWEGGASAGIIREIFPVGDRVMARADWVGRGRASGIELRSSLTSINTVRDGRIVKIEYFFDHAQALETLGLPE